MKAKQIVESKVDEDLAQKEDEDLKQRADEFKKERFELFMAGATLALQTGFDTNKYEDFARVILGGKAYLLFSFEKLIITVMAFNFHSIDCKTVVSSLVRRCEPKKFQSLP